ncbi:type VI secretion system protein TssL, long form [Variovorax sp. UC122_21]|uniref:type VI secretion system protein TssL, long form n=1 Tax=Variovorax sp. UC122_21 TaxID=3374554 RepID=UPI003756B4BC
MHDFEEKSDPAFGADDFHDGGADPLFADGADRATASPAEGGSVRERVAVIVAARNPLLEAAGPLLRALADLPPTLGAEGVQLWHGLLEREVAAFQSICAAARIRHEHALAASYALCTAIDEAANSTAWGGGQAGEAGVWAGLQLAARFHGDTKGGDKFFLLIGRLATDPEQHADLLELMYQVLGLGFEGRFSTAAHGRRQLEAVRHRLFELLATVRVEVPHALSPHWKGAPAGRLRLARSLPVWITGVVAVLVLSGLFGWYRYQLSAMSSALTQRIATIGRMRPPTAAMVPPARALRLKELLSAEIARGSVSVEEDAQRSAVSFRGDQMFVPGRASLNARTLAALGKVADEINQVAGTVQVIGHTDNRPIRTREFPDNQVLSEKRAAAVAAVLLDKGVEASRIRSTGQGETSPLDDNATVQGRARNRRVDIVVSQDAGIDPQARAAASVRGESLPPLPR